MSRLLAATAVIALLAAAVATSHAQAIQTNCLVNASGGFANCLALSNPLTETVDANHASGLPYRFQLKRFSDGATWGWWQFNDLSGHILGISLSGVITAQVDNLGSGNPSSYFVELN